MKSFIESQFNSCPLVWMFHSKHIDGRINRLHERALRVVYKDENLTFEQLLDKDNSFKIHHKNLQPLALLMFKVKNKLCPTPIQEIFKFQNGKFILPKIRTERMGRETLRYSGPITWNLVPAEIKSAKTLQSFTNKIKKWKPQGCTCRLCTLFVKGVGFVNVAEPGL